VDKTDLKRYGDFVHRKTYDLLLMAQAKPKANARDVIEPFDLPITCAARSPTALGIAALEDKTVP
jgi:uncharacterized protein DUF1931